MRPYDKELLGAEIQALENPRSSAVCLLKANNKLVMHQIPKEFVSISVNNSSYLVDSIWETDR